jgi:hypothetical protein
MPARTEDEALVEKTVWGVQRAPIVLLRAGISASERGDGSPVFLTNDGRRELIGETYHELPEASHILATTARTSRCMRTLGDDARRWWSDGAGDGEAQDEDCRWEAHSSRHL